MVIWLRKSKKGFTLIELMVVVAVIGVLVLLGLRTYVPQKERVANSIVKANASTIQTMLVAYMGDNDIAGDGDIELALGPENATQVESMINPYSDLLTVYHIDAGGDSAFDATDAGLQGRVSVNLFSTNNLYINSRGKKGELIMIPANTKSLPALKY
jgi:prepilin-type N-terminal cleavage/methylation domain-containing protein